MNNLCRALTFFTLAPSILGFSQTKGAIKQAIGAKYTLAQSNDNRTDLVAPGSAIQLLKDDVVFGTTALVGAEIDGKGIIIDPPTSAYANGKFERRGSTRFGRFLSDANYRSLLAGDKCWLIDVDVKDDGAILEFLSEPIHGVRYRALLKYPFTKGQIPTADAVLQQIAETITAEPLHSASTARDSSGPPGPAAASPDGISTQRSASSVPSNITHLHAQTARTDRAKVVILDPGAPGSPCSEGFCAVERNGVWGALDYQGNVVINFQYESAFVFSEGLAAVQLPQTHVLSYIDKRGAVKFSAAATGPGGRSFLNGYALGAYGFFDVKGSFHHLTYAAGESEFSEGLASYQPATPQLVKTSGGYIDTNMNVAFNLPPGVTEFGPFHEDLAWIHYAKPGQAPKWGAIDKAGKAVIAFQFTEEPGPFSDGLASVVDAAGKVGYIDKTGQLVIACQFAPPPSRNSATLSNDPGNFVSGHALVTAIAAHTPMFSTPVTTLVLIDHQAKLVDTQGVVFDGRTAGKGLYSFKLSSNAPCCGVMTGDGIVLFTSDLIILNPFPDDPAGLAWASTYIGQKPIEGFVNRSGDFVVIRGQSQF